MHIGSDSECAQNRRIGLHLTRRSLAPRVLEALCELGYALVERDEIDRTSFEDQHVWLVDLDRLGDFPDARAEPDIQLLLITPPGQGHATDSRVLAHTTRPGRLGPVYEMIQGALELNPRRCPRIRTQLSARCIRSNRRAIGAVLSLSEGGCMLRMSESLRKGTRVDVQFALPNCGLISTHAECRFTRGRDAGLAFTAPTSDIRNTIAQYVTLQLAMRHDLSRVGPPQDALPGA